MVKITHRRFTRTLKYSLRSICSSLSSSIMDFVICYQLFVIYLKKLNNSKLKIDGLVKSREFTFFVIPAKAGIQ